MTSEDKKIIPDKEKISNKENVSETKENIIAISLFIIVILLIIGLFTKGFGFFGEKQSDEGVRFNVLIGNDPFTGAENPKIIIVAFSDYECSFCKKAELTITELLKEYPDELAFVFMDFPLTKIHANAYNAALAAECAKEQGKFWEYHEMLFNNQKSLSIDKLKSYAATIYLDADQFNSCFDEMKYRYEIDKDIKQGYELGISGTPAFFINGIKITGAKPKEEFVKIIEEELSMNK